MLSVKFNQLLSFESAGDSKQHPHAHWKHWGSQKKKKIRKIGMPTSETGAAAE